MQVHDLVPAQLDGVHALLWVNGYLSMVMVSPAHRSQGIGRALVQHITGNHPNVTWVLRAGRAGAAGFFSKLGFSVSSVAMERTRG